MMEDKVYHPRDLTLDDFGAMAWAHFVNPFLIKVYKDSKRKPGCFSAGMNFARRNPALMILLYSTTE